MRPRADDRQGARHHRITGPPRPAVERLRTMRGTPEPPRTVRCVRDRPSEPDGLGQPGRLRPIPTGSDPQPPPALCPRDRRADGGRRARPFCPPPAGRRLGTDRVPSRTLDYCGNLLGSVMAATPMISAKVRMVSGSGPGASALTPQLPAHAPLGVALDVRGELLDQDAVKLREVGQVLHVHARRDELGGEHQPLELLLGRGQLLRAPQIAADASLLHEILQGRVVDRSHPGQDVDRRRLLHLPPLHPSQVREGDPQPRRDAAERAARCVPQGLDVLAESLGARGRLHFLRPPAIWPPDEGRGHPASGLRADRG